MEPFNNTASLLVALLAFTVGGCRNGNQSGKPDAEAWSNISLPHGRVVSVHEQMTHMVNGDDYQYEFIYEGRVIASSNAEVPLPVIMVGEDGDTSYFFQQNMLCVFHGGVWTEWRLGEQLPGKWSRCLYEASCGIRGFANQGERWVVTLGRSEYDYAASVRGPVLMLDIESSDFGATWRVAAGAPQERATGGRTPET